MVAGDTAGFSIALLRGYGDRSPEAVWDEATEECVNSASEKQAEYVLQTVAKRGIRFIRLWFTDVQGFLKSVAISPAELETAFREGMTFDGSAIDGYARIQEADMVARPDPTTFQILPWRENQGVARMFCDIELPNGGPFPGDPRHVLRRNLKEAAAMGYTFYVGPELEYFYFADAGPEPQVLDRGGYFDLTPLDAAQEYRRRTIEHLEALGIPVEYSHHEVAPSQHEINLRYDDALTMADNVMTYRLTVKEVALQEGIYATFMPKPLEEHDGSGFHMHLSLFEGDVNAFHDGSSPTGLSKVGRRLHGRTPASCSRHDRHHQPVGQLLQATRGGIRGSHLRLLGPQQPVGTGPGSVGEIRQAFEHPARISIARCGHQPLPRVLGSSGGGTRRYSAGNGPSG